MMSRFNFVISKRICVAKSEVHRVALFYLCRLLYIKRHRVGFSLETGWYNILA